jgi:hypothetical protein
MVYASESASAATKLRDRERPFFSDASHCELAGLTPISSFTSYMVFRNANSFDATCIEFHIELCQDTFETIFPQNQSIVQNSFQSNTSGLQLNP